MNNRLTTALLVALLVLATPWGAAASINTVTKLVISGPQYTDLEVLEQYIPIRIGQPSRQHHLSLVEERLDALNVSASTTATRVHTVDGYEVLVRINDGKGFVVEPIEFTASSIINLMLGNLKLMYHNLGGKAINPYVIYNLSDHHDLTVGLQFPGIRLPLHHELAYSQIKDEYQSGSGTVTLHSNDVSVKTSWIPYPGWHPSLTLTRSGRTIDTAVSSQEDWTIYTLEVPYQSHLEDLNYSLEFDLSSGSEKSGRHYHKKVSSVSVTYDQPRYSLKLSTLLGRMTSEAPIDQLFYLGGNEIQKGYPEQAFSGPAVFNTAFEVGYKLRPYSIQLKSFVEVGKIGESLDSLRSETVRASGGIGIDVPNPSGLLTMFVATPLEDWHPRFALRFQF